MEKMDDRTELGSPTIDISEFPLQGSPVSEDENSKAKCDEVEMYNLVVATNLKCLFCSHLIFLSDHIGNTFHSCASHLVCFV